MSLDPKYIETGVETAQKELNRDKTNWKEFIQYVRSIPKNIIKDTLLIAPRFILLLIKVLKSKESDASLKILISGMIIVLSTLIGYIIWDMSTIAIFVGMAASFGVFSAAATVLFGSLVIIIKSSLTAALILISMYFCNQIITTDELKELSNEAFGEEEGSSFIEKYLKLIDYADNKTEQFVKPIRKFFEKVGKKKIKKKGEDLDFSELENKINSKLS